jgi:hypothetical protein
MAVRSQLILPTNVDLVVHTVAVVVVDLGEAVVVVAAADSVEAVVVADSVEAVVGIVEVAGEVAEVVGVAVVGLDPGIESCRC